MDKKCTAELFPEIFTELYNLTKHVQAFCHF